MSVLLQFLHRVAPIVWLDGMAWVRMTLRPSLNTLHTPAQRLPLLTKVLRRFSWPSIPIPRQ